MITPALLKNIYKSDITHLLNFQFYKRKFKKKLDEVKITTQREFLIKYGILERKEILSKSNDSKLINDELDTLINNVKMGSIFKFLVVSNLK